MVPLNRIFLLAAIAAFTGSPQLAAAYGAAGHRIAGLAAEPLLCKSAIDSIAALTSGESLSELGLWADRIRGTDRWQRSAPWHYMNIADNANVPDFRHPPEGDVLWAIGEFSAQLGDAERESARRAEALRFLVHFVVDIHQPLHVGRAEDRGGNRTPIRYSNTEVDLHRFWDTDAIGLADLSVAAYTRAIRDRVAHLARADAGSTPIEWATESLELRDAVYDFRRARASRAYLDRAERLTRERLALAAARLANTLNGIFCR